MDNSNTIGSRLVEAFETSDKAFIAEKLGFRTVGGLYKVLSGERELDFEKLLNFRKHTKRTIDWLLTGEGEPDPALEEEALRAVIDDTFVRSFAFIDQRDHALARAIIGVVFQEFSDDGELYEPVASILDQELRTDDVRDVLRDIIRPIVQEEIGRSRKRRVHEIDLTAEEESQETREAG